MRILVAGLGQLARSLIKLALSQRSEVVGIDHRRELCDEVARLGVLTINDDPTSKDALINAGVRDADAVIYTLGDDSKNLMGCILAKQLGAKLVISLVNDPEHEEAFLREGILTANASGILAHQIYSMALSTGSPQLKWFSSIDQDLSLVGIKLESGSNLIQRELGKLELGDVALMGIKRDGKLISDPQAKLEAGDLLLIITTSKDLRKLLEKLS